MTKRGLIVEIDDGWVDLFKRYLGSMGVETRAVNRYEDALEEIQVGNYDLVTLDLSLDAEKRFDWGNTLLASIKSKQLSVPPIIVVSGTAEIEDLVHCINDYREYIYYFCRKTVPWQYLNFINAVNEVLNLPKEKTVSQTDVSQTDKDLTTRPIFISHTGASTALNKLTRFLAALQVPYIVAEEQPTLSTSVKNHVLTQMNKCGAALILKSRDTSRSVLIEQGQLEERFPGRVIQIVERGTPEGPLEVELVRESFNSNNMERAFIFIARELNALGYFGK